MANKKEIDLSEYAGRFIDPDEYFDKRRQQALKFSQERTEGYPVPEWWIKQGNRPEDFENCISTALSSYGQKNPVTGNLTFYNNPEASGFRRLNDNEPSLPGDIVQTAGYDPKLPSHSFIINELDENGGFKTINYGNGSGGYEKGERNWFSNNPYNHRYRYIGLPEERAAIEQHNIEYRKNYKPEPLQSKVAPLKVNPLTEIANRRQLLRKL